MRSGTHLRCAVTTLTLALGACGGGDATGVFSPTMTNVAGSYHATTFTAGLADLLSIGATVDITLASNGTTSGHLSVPTAGDNGGTLQEDLAGTWSLSGNTVTFSQTSGTLIQSAEFTATENQLSGSGTFETVPLTIVLQKN
jgi:hypothetical protein